MSEERWKAAAHAVQSGVAAKMSIDPTDTQPKHLRTGINVALADQAGLAELLMAKGVITRDEYMEAIAGSMEAEQSRYEEELTQMIGKPITLA
jgi:phosphotransferase system IIB component